MLGHIQHLAPLIQLVIVAAYNAVEVEPSQFHSENVFENRCQEEGRQRYTKHSKHSDAIVKTAVLVPCGLNTKRNTDGNLQDQRNHVENNGIPDNIVKLLGNRHAVLPALAKVALEHVAQPVQITADNAVIHMIGFIQFFQPFFIAGTASGSACCSALTGKTFHKGGGHAAHDAINDERAANNNHNSQANTPDNKLPHLCISSPSIFLPEFSSWLRPTSAGRRRLT